MDGGFDSAALDDQDDDQDDLEDDRQDHPGGGLGVGADGVGDQAEVPQAVDEHRQQEHSADAQAEVEEVAGGGDDHGLEDGLGAFAEGVADVDEAEDHRGPQGDLALAEAGALEDLDADAAEHQLLTDADQRGHGGQGEHQRERLVGEVGVVHADDGDHQHRDGHEADPAAHRDAVVEDAAPPAEPGHHGSAEQDGEADGDHSVGDDRLGGGELAVAVGPVDADQCAEALDDHQVDDDHGQEPGPGQPAPGRGEAGVNCLRAFPGQGLLVWGARTLSTNGAFIYLIVRRLVNFLTESIRTSTTWTTSEANDERLWVTLNDSVTSFLTDQWRRGAAQGRTAEEAFFVICDRSNNPDESVKVIVDLGVAPVRPAEFVHFSVTLAGRVQWPLVAAGRLSFSRRPAVLAVDRGAGRTARDIGATPPPVRSARSSTTSPASRISCDSFAPSRGCSPPAPCPSTCSVVPAVSSACCGA